MSYEQTSPQLYTAEDLFQFLKNLPPALREDLPLSFMFNEGTDGFDGAFIAEAYDVRETEGCIERGFRISPESC